MKRYVKYTVAVLNTDGSEKPKAGPFVDNFKTKSTKARNLAKKILRKHRIKNTEAVIARYRVWPTEQHALHHKPPTEGDDLYINCRPPKGKPGTTIPLHPKMQATRRRRLLTR